MTECPTCGRSWPVPTDVCVCGHQFVAATAETEALAPVPVPAAPQSPYSRSWADTPRAETWHRIPPAGLQGYAEPGTEGAPGQFVAGNTQVGLVKTQGEWAQIVVGGSTTWVDGRELMPPAGGRITTGTRSAPSTSSRRSTPARVNIWPILCSCAGVGIIIGAWLKWVQTIFLINSFHIGLPFLFGDDSVLNSGLAVGYFVLLFGLVGLLAAYRADLTWLRRLAGVLALGIVVLFCVRVQDSVAPSGQNFTDIISGGPWVVGICGLALAVLPGPRR